VIDNAGYTHYFFLRPAYLPGYFYVFFITKMKKSFTKCNRRNSTYKRAHQHSANLNPKHDTLQQGVNAQPIGNPMNMQ